MGQLQLQVSAGGLLQQSDGVEGEFFSQQRNYKSRIVNLRKLHALMGLPSNYAPEKQIITVNFLMAEATGNKNLRDRFSF